MTYVNYMIKSTTAVSYNSRPNSRVQIQVHIRNHNVQNILGAFPAYYQPQLSYEVKLPAD
jgi:hypothetical protein